MVKNITLFNYKNTSVFAKSKFFFDILFNHWGYSNTFAHVGLSIARENSLMVKLQSSKLLI